MNLSEQITWNSAGDVPAHFDDKPHRAWREAAQPEGQPPLRHLKKQQCARADTQQTTNQWRREMLSLQHLKNDRRRLRPHIGSLNADIGVAMAADSVLPEGRLAALTAPYCPGSSEAEQTAVNR